ncbi:kinase-like domain-containing protein [Podospora aff. communis PSN243]|uniref:Kinase-like domain-containing protein n=1 Tax=Podospora aff. communis PSN243 TaxID=3040156 RepID=A0AAV9GN84_9PEZI|nr:kinase-like domain-containing protein [Podospora aff. communis PSN243]
MAAPPPLPVLPPHSVRYTVPDFQGNANQDHYSYLLAQKRRLSDQFAHYRRNEPFFDNQRQHVCHNYVIPRQFPLQWPGMQHLPPSPTASAVGSDYTPIGPAAAINAALNQHLNNAQREATRAAAEQLYYAASGLNFVRLVGWGGQGLVAIFDARPSEHLDRRYGFEVDAATQHVVVKCLHSASNNARRCLQRERAFLRDDYARAAHVVQLARINRPGRSRVLTQTTSRRPRAGADASIDTLILEYLPRGDMSKILHAAGARPQNGPQNITPQPVLWNFFGCLVRGVIALQYSPNRQPRNRHKRIISERMRRATRTKPFPMRNEYTTDLVHFDLDPQNVLVGDFDYSDGRREDVHSIAPVLKIADLGYARSKAQEPDVFDDPLRLNTIARSGGKLGYMVPEQFSEEWDWVDLLPDSQIHKVAGNFGSHTNVFQIGLIMYAAITQCQTPDVGAPPPDIFADIWLGGPMALVNGWTYGSYLDSGNFDDVSYELRYLVKQCLCDDPSHRPHPGYLMVRIRSWIKEDWTGHYSPTNMRQWMESHIENPPPLIARSTFVLEQWITKAIRLRDLNMDATPDYWG